MELEHDARSVLPALEKMEQIGLTAGHFLALIQQDVCIAFQEETVPLQTSFCSTLLKHRLFL